MQLYYENVKAFPYFSRIRFNAIHHAKIQYPFCVQQEYPGGANYDRQSLFNETKYTPGKKQLFNKSSLASTMALDDGATRYFIRTCI